MRGDDFSSAEVILNNGEEKRRKNLYFMKKKRNYVSPLWQGFNPMEPGDDPIIVIGGSMDTGGTVGGECWSVVDMLSGDPAGKIVGCDGTELGYLDMNEWILYDKNGQEVLNFYEDYMGDVDDWLEDQGWSCYTACPELAD